MSDVSSQMTADRAIDAARIAVDATGGHLGVFAPHACLDGTDFSFGKVGFHVNLRVSREQKKPRPRGVLTTQCSLSRTNIVPTVFPVKGLRALGREQVVVFSPWRLRWCGRSGPAGVRWPGARGRPVARGRPGLFSPRRRYFTLPLPTLTAIRATFAFYGIL